MTRDQEYGPWIEHDGKGCPFFDVVMEVEDEDGYRAECVAPGFFHINHWYTGREPYAPITRYRIRKPDALRALIAMVENIGAPARPERVEA